MHATRRIAPMLFACALALSGCSAATSTPTTPAVSAAPIPAGGASLTALGVKHGPVGFWLPTGLLPIDVIDQANVVALIFAPGGASGIVDHLVANAASMGFTVTQHNETSVQFVAPGWDASFTSSADAAGLTLRRTKG